MRLVFGKAHVKGHYRTDPTTHQPVYVKPHEDKRTVGSESFRMWRVQGGTIRHAVPGQSISPQQAEQLIARMKRSGLEGEFIYGKKGSSWNIYVSGVSRRDLDAFWNKHGSAAVQSDKQEKIKSDMQARKDLHKRELADGLDQAGEAASWISNTFGVHAMNDYNRLQLAKYLSGEEKKFNGMVNRSWLEGLEKLGAIVENRVDFEKIKEAFHSRKSAVPESASSTSPESGSVNQKEQLNLFKSIRAKLALWFGKTFAKSHVKTYTRSDGTVVREHNDKRRSAQPDQKKPRGPAKPKPKKGRASASQDESPKPQVTDQPEYPLVQPAKEGELAAWLDKIMQEPDIHAAMEEVMAGTPTDKIYKTQTGEYQPDRAKLHESIVAAMLNPKAVAAEGQRPHAMIFMGRPASGKTSALQPAAQELGVEFTVINADDVKEKLPEYNGRNAGVVHEESSDIAEGQLFPKALEAGHNILLDVTGGNAAKLTKWVEHFHQLGFEISIMMADLPIEKACARAVNRFRHTGRFVPPNYIADNVDHKPEKTYDILKDDPRVSHWRRYSTDVEKGEPNPLREQGSKEVSGNPFHKGGDFEPVWSILSRQDGQDVRGHGGEPERSDYRGPGQVPGQVEGLRSLPVNPVITRAYAVLDTLTKSIQHYTIDLSSPDLTPDVRGTLLAARHQQQTRLEQLNDMIAKAEA